MTTKDLLCGVAAMLMVATLSATLLTVTGCGGTKPDVTSTDQNAETDSSQADNEAIHALYDRAKTAARDEDYRTFVTCMTPDSQEAFAGALVIAGKTMQIEREKLLSAPGIGDAASPELRKAALDRVDDVFARNGIRSSKPGDPPLIDPSTDMSAVMKSEGASIEDKAAFAQDLIPLLKQVAGAQAMSDQQLEGELVGLEIDGEKASGTTFSEQNGIPRREPIEFQKTHDGWRIALPM